MPISECPPVPTNEELFDLYKKTFELWLKKPNQISSIEPLETIIKSLLGNSPKLCSFGSSCLKRIITIDQDGNVVPCSSLVNNEFVLGNVLREPLIQIIGNKKSLYYRKSRDIAVKKLCDKCEFISICRGGCRADAFWSSGDYNGEYPYCEARRKIFAHIKSRLNEIIKKAC